MVLIIMGVSGTGKTTIGKMLAAKLALPFHDADDFHSQGNLEKMHNNFPLTDEDRTPWLFDLAIHVAQWNRHGGAVLACSALKEKYRDILDWNKKEDVAFIYLRGEREVILSRMRDRNGHFFPPDLLDSQFEDIEEPHDAVTISIDGSADDMCAKIIDEIASRKILPQSYIRSLNLG